MTNGRRSVDTSPEAGGGADDSVLWSTSFIGSRRNPIQRLDTFDRANRYSTPLRQYNVWEGTSVGNTPNSSQRFVTRPNPERLAAHIKSVEATQELIMVEKNKKP